MDFRDDLESYLKATSAVEKTNQEGYIEASRATKRARMNPAHPTEPQDAADPNSPRNPPAAPTTSLSHGYGRQPSNPAEFVPTSPSSNSNLVAVEKPDGTTTKPTPSSTTPMVAVAPTWTNYRNPPLPEHLCRFLSPEMVAAAAQSPRNSPVSHASSQPVSLSQFGRAPTTAVLAHREAHTGIPANSSPGFQFSSPAVPSSDINGTAYGNRAAAEQSPRNAPVNLASSPLDHLRRFARPSATSVLSPSNAFVSYPSSPPPGSQSPASSTIPPAYINGLAYANRAHHRQPTQLRNVHGTSPSPKNPPHNLLASSPPGYHTPVQSASPSPHRYTAPCLNQQWQNHVHQYQDQTAATLSIPTYRAPSLPELQRQAQNARSDPLPSPNTGSGVSNFIPSSPTGPPTPLRTPGLGGYKDATPLDDGPQRSQSLLPVHQRLNTDLEDVADLAGQTVSLPNENTTTQAVPLVTRSFAPAIFSPVPKRTPISLRQDVTYPNPANTAFDISPHYPLGQSHLEYHRKTASPGCINPKMLEKPDPSSHRILGAPADIDDHEPRSHRHPLTSTVCQPSPYACTRHARLVGGLNHTIIGGHRYCIYAPALPGFKRVRDMDDFQRAALKETVAIPQDPKKKDPNPNKLSQVHKASEMSDVALMQDFSFAEQSIAADTFQELMRYKENGYKVHLPTMDERKRKFQEDVLELDEVEKRILYGDSAGF